MPWQQRTQSSACLTSLNSTMARHSLRRYPEIRPCCHRPSKNVLSLIFGRFSNRTIEACFHSLRYWCLARFSRTTTSRSLRRDRAVLKIASMSLAAGGGTGGGGGRARRLRSGFKWWMKWCENLDDKQATSTFQILRDTCIFVITHFYQYTFTKQTSNLKRNKNAGYIFYNLFATRLEYDDLTKR